MHPDFAAQLAGRPNFIKAEAEDLEPGSRIFRIDAKEECKLDIFGAHIGCASLFTNFAPTFIPSASAVPSGGPFAASWFSLEGYNAVHGGTRESSLNLLLDELDARTANQFGAPSISAAADPVRPFDVGTGAQPVTVIYPNQLADGETTLTISGSGPAPFPRRVLGTPGIYYDLSSTVEFGSTRNNPIRVCIDYSGVTYMDESHLKLFHHDASGWTDVTTSVDPDRNEICGAATSFSPFAIFEPANQQPVAIAGRNLVVEATSAAGALVRLSSAGSFDPDQDAVTHQWSDSSQQAFSIEEFPRVPFALGHHETTLRVTDARGATASDTVEIAVRDTTPPTAVLSISGAKLRTLSAVASDAVGVSFVQFLVDGAPLGEPVIGEPYSTVWDTTSSSDGVHVVVVKATDTSGNTFKTGGVSVVVDNTPPTVTLSVAPHVVWPPNKRLVPIAASLAISDSVDPAPSVRLESVSCDDGCDPSRDIAGATIGTDDRTVSIRADRKGTGSARTYRIVYVVTDAAGNGSRAAATVTVPHDRR